MHPFHFRDSTASFTVVLFSLFTSSTLLSGKTVITAGQHKCTLFGGESVCLFLTICEHIPLKKKAAFGVITSQNTKLCCLASFTSSVNRNLKPHYTLNNVLVGLLITVSETSFRVIWEISSLSGNFSNLDTILQSWAVHAAISWMCRAVKVKWV